MQFLIIIVLYLKHQVCNIIIYGQLHILFVERESPGKTTEMVEEEKISPNFLNFSHFDCDVAGIWMFEGTIVKIAKKNSRFNCVSSSNGVFDLDLELVTSFTEIKKWTSWAELGHTRYRLLDFPINF